LSTAFFQALPPILLHLPVYVLYCWPLLHISFAGVFLGDLLGVFLGGLLGVFRLDELALIHPFSTAFFQALPPILLHLPVWVLYCSLGAHKDERAGCCGVFLGDLPGVFRLDELAFIHPFSTAFFQALPPILLHLPVLVLYCSFFAHGDLRDGFSGVFRLDELAFIHPFSMAFFQALPPILLHLPVWVLYCSLSVHLTVWSTFTGVFPLGELTNPRFCRFLYALVPFLIHLPVLGLIIEGLPCRLHDA
jgi:hypothetical protein